jgi:hypothetical protein
MLDKKKTQTKRNHQTVFPKNTKIIIFKVKNSIFKQRNALQLKVYIGLTTFI